MLSYCLKCKRKTKTNKQTKNTIDNKNQRFENPKNWRRMLSSNCAVCGSKISRQEASGLLSNLGIKAPLSQVQYCVLLYFKGIKWMKQ